jgi:hypothetical protein
LPLAVPALPPFAIPAKIAAIASPMNWRQRGFSSGMLGEQACARMRWLVHNKLAGA